MSPAREDGNNDILAPRLPAGYSFQVEAGTGNTAVWIYLRKTVMVRSWFRRIPVQRIIGVRNVYKADVSVGDLARVTAVTMRDMWNIYSQSNALSLEAAALEGEYPPRYALKEDR